LRDDVGERRNVAADHPEVVAHLRQLHQAWMKDLNATEHAAAEVDP
jgi:hypothetical protein